MIVIDASVLANIVGDDGPIGQAMRERMRAADTVALPDIADAETVSVLRKRWIAGALNTTRFELALENLLELPAFRFPVRFLMRRAFELRDNVTPYDAAYIALAESLGFVLITGDARMTRAPGIRCPIELIAIPPDP